MYKLKDKKIVVVGLGRSGVAAAKYLYAKGALVTISDKRDETCFHKEVKQLEGLSINFSFGKNDKELFSKADLIVLSPGVPLNIDALNKAKQNGVPIIGELELAVSNIKKPIIAVTGTNGKTTTTSLIHHILTESDVKSCVGGNIGTALSSLIDEANNSDWVVVEVSSYQIETTPSLSPKIAVLLNIDEDHLERHFTFDEYKRIKGLLINSLNMESFGIYNAHDKNVSSIINNKKAQLLPFDVSKHGPLNMDENTFGGGFAQNKLLTNIPLRGVEKWSLENVSLKGFHNVENVLVSVMVACLCEIKFEKIQKAIESFKGLAHRMQFVRNCNGVKYFNDSKGTNVAATKAALESFDSNIILIAGGLDKGGSYKSLSYLVSTRVKKIILIGQASEKIEKELGSLTETVKASSMQEAVKIAYNNAQPNDIVLLSPACASFDMFADYTKRGESFIEVVNKL